MNNKLKKQELVFKLTTNPCVKNTNLKDKTQNTKRLLFWSHAHLCARLRKQHTTPH